MGRRLVAGAYRDISKALIGHKPAGRGARTTPQGRGHRRGTAKESANAPFSAARAG